MSEPTVNRDVIPNGSGAAAVLAAGIGSCALAVIAMAADRLAAVKNAMAADRLAAVKNAMAFYKPTGPLSGVTLSAIVLWLVVWFALDRLWRRKDVAMSRIAVWALVLLALSVLLTFPPIADWF